MHNRSKMEVVETATASQIFGDFVGNLGGKNHHGNPWRERLRKGKLTVFDSDVPGSSLLLFKAVYEFDAAYSVDAVLHEVMIESNRVAWDSSLAEIESVPVTLPSPLIVPAATLSALSDAINVAVPPSTTASEATVTLVRSATKAVYTISSRDFIDVSVALKTESAFVSAAGGYKGGALRESFKATSARVRGNNSSGCGECTYSSHHRFRRCRISSQHLRGTPPCLGSLSFFMPPPPNRYAPPTISAGWVFYVPTAGAATSSNAAASAASKGTMMHYVVHSDIGGWIPTFVVNSAMTNNMVSFFEALEKRLRAQVVAPKA